MEVLWLKSHGLTHDQIAAAADVSRRTVQRYLDQYYEGGLPHLRRCRWHHPHSALAKHQDSLEEYFLKHPVRSAKQCGPSLSSRPASAGASARSATSSRADWGCAAQDRGHPRAAPADGRGARPGTGHLRAREVRAAPGAGPPRPEAGLLRGRGPLRLRAVPGLPVVRGAAVRAGGLGSQAVQRPGALDAVTHRLVRVTNHDYINAESVCACCAVAAASVGVPITLVLDNARYQKCALVQALASSLGIELLYLPGYSPNLNLIERLWRFVRKQSLDSIYYEDFARFTAAIDQCLGDLPTVHKGEMATLERFAFGLRTETIHIEGHDRGRRRQRIRRYLPCVPLR